MPIALTNPETQETFEAPTFSEWEQTLGRPANAKDVARFAKITTAQMSRAGVDSEEEINGLYNSLYSAAAKRQIVPGTDPENEFKSIFDQDHRDDTQDFDLVADQLEADQRIDDATKVRSAAESLRAGLEVPDLEDIRTGLLNPETVQAARIKYARDNGLPFIDYKMTDGGTGVYINPNANLERDSIFKAAVDRSDVVDPTLAKFAYDQTVPETEGGVAPFKAARVQEAASIISKLSADGNAEFERLRVALRDANEAVADFVEEREVKGTTAPPIYGSTYAGFGPPTKLQQIAPKVTIDDLRQKADAVLAEALGALRKNNPDSPLFDEYTDDEIKGAFGDIVIQQAPTKADLDNPEKNFATLSSGIRVPIGNASLMLSQKQIDEAAAKIGLSENEKAIASAMRTSAVEGNIHEIEKALNEFDGENYASYMRNNLDSEKNKTQLVSEYLDQLSGTKRNALKTKLQGIGWSVADSFSDLYGATTAGWGSILGAEGVQKSGENILIKNETDRRRRSMYLGYAGAEPGIFYEAASQLAPLVVDIAVSRGAGLIGKGLARGAAKLALPALRKLPGATGFIRNAGVSFIERAMAVSPEARSLAQKAFAPILEKYTVQGAEQNARKIFQAIGRDINKNAGQFTAQKTAQAAQIGTSFTRSAAASWTNTYIDMRAERNPDGTPKYTEQEVRDAAFANGMVSGGITAVTEFAFGKLLGEGADVTTFGRMNVRQLKAYTNRLNQAFAKSGFGGGELYGVLKKIGSDAVKAAYGEAFKQIPADAAEEFTDELVQGVALDLLNDRKLDIETAFKNALKAGVIGGIFGGAIGTPAKLGVFRANLAKDLESGTVQAAQQEVLAKAIADLDATGSTKTADILRERARLAQRRGVSVDAVVTPVAMRRYLQDRFDALPEQPAPQPYVAPVVAPTPVSLTAKARATAKKLRVSSAELATIQPSGKDNTITPNDIERHAAARGTARVKALQTSSVAPLLSPKAAERAAELNVTAEELAGIKPARRGGKISPNQVVQYAKDRDARAGITIIEEAAPEGEEAPPQEPTVPAAERTFRELEGQVVVINNYGRGRVRIDTDTGDVLLDKEDGTPPLLLTPNANMVAGEFEGFNTVLGQPAAVAPRRGVRRVEPIDFGTFTQDGKIVYGGTEYRLPVDPLYANIVRNSEGVIDSMNVRVYDKDGNSTWVYVDGQDIDLIRQAYEARGDDSEADHDRAIETATRQDIARNQAAIAERAKKSRKNRAAKRARTGGPVISNSGQEAVNENPDLRLVDINDPKAPVGLKQLIRDTAAQLGLDPDVFTDRAELLEILGPEIASGLDFDSVSQEDIALANARMIAGRPPKSLLELLILSEQQELLGGGRMLQAKIARNRARNSGQVKRHKIQPGRVADVGALLENIARTATSKVHRDTARRVLERGVGNTPVYFVDLKSNLGLAGAYLPNSNAVVVNLASDNGGGPIDALLHELGHSRYDRALDDQTDASSIKLRQDLSEIRERLVARMNEVYGENPSTELRYALEGRISSSEQFNERVAMREFVAHFSASEDFRKQVRLLDVEGERSFLRRIIDAIADFFGVNRSSASEREVLDLLTRIDQTISAKPYGQSVGSMSASRVAFDQRQPAGPNFGLPNPHPRDSFAWTEFAIDALANQPVDAAAITDVLRTGKWAMLTGENPNGIVIDDASNSSLNESAKAWLRDRGYDVYDIVGRYEGNGENSFLVPGMTIEEAVGFANQFGQKEVATADGLVDRSGSYYERDSEADGIGLPIASDDDYFSAIRDANGMVLPIRINYTSVKAQLDLAAPAARTAFEERIGHAVRESAEFDTPVTFDGNTIFRNPDAIAQKYAGYAAADVAALVEFDSAVAVAAYKAANSAAVEDVGFSAEQFIRDAVDTSLDQAVVRTLAQTSPEVARFVADAFNTFTVVNDGSNTLIAEAVNSLGDLARGIFAGNTDVGEAKPFDPSNPEAGLAELTDRLNDIQPVVSKSRIAIDPVATKARVKAGRTVGSRSPTGVGRRGEGVNNENLVDLQTMRANNPFAYRKNALLLCEYPIIARKYPKLAKQIRAWVAADEKIKRPGKLIAAKITAENKKLRGVLAEMFGAASEKEVAKSRIDDAAEAFASGGEKGLTAYIVGLEGRATKKLVARYAKTADRIATLRGEKEAADITASALSKARSSEIDRLANTPRVITTEIADDIYRTLQADTQANLMALIELFPPDVREVAKLWYDGANIIANEFAKRSNVSVEKAAGILAVFSPQKDWFMNVTIAERMMEIYTNEQAEVWNEDMSRNYLIRSSEPEQKVNKKTGELEWPKGVVPILDANGDHMVDSDGMLMFEGWSAEKREAARKKAVENLKQVEGKPLSALTLEQQAWFIRMREETKYPGREFRTVSPSGEFGGNKVTDKGVPQKMGWGGYDTIRKAISIFNAPADTELQVISEQLGNKHKVRSFYNNIVDPANESGHVTMDTHAVAALLWMPLSGGSREVLQNFGGENTPSDSATGISGLYAAFAEAYRSLAVRQLAAGDGNTPYLAREVQSVTWEAVRELFPAKWKSRKTNVDAVRAIWAEYESIGPDADQATVDAALREAQRKIYKLAHGKDLDEAIRNAGDPMLGLKLPVWVEIDKAPLDNNPKISRSIIATPPETRQEAAGYVVAKFRAVAKRLGVDLVPNIVGYPARYVVDSKQGSRYIEYNPGTFVGVSLEEIDATFREEIIHAANHNALIKRKTDWVEFQSALGKSLSKEERAAVKSIYKSVRNDMDYGAEYLRMAVQKLLYGTVTEAEVRSKSFDKILGLLKDSADFFRTTDRVDQLTRAVFDDTVNLVRKADPKFATGVRTTKTPRGISRSMIQVASQQDAKYLRLAANPEVNRAELQRMVDAAARDAGYTIEGWHGTNQDDIREFYPNTWVATREDLALVAGVRRPKNKVRVFLSVDALRLDEDQMELFDRALGESALSPDKANAAGMQFLNEAFDRGYDAVFFPGYAYLTGNSEQIKSADPVTYDDAGNVIPLSQRFQAFESDIRYSKVAARQPVMQAFQPEAIDRANTGWKSRSVIVEMNIDDFLKYATPLDKEQRREARAAFEQGTKWESIPQLLFSHDEEYGRRVTGHEGRHRALVLKDAGYTTMPVEIRDQYIRWSEQGNPSNFGYATEFPTTARSEDGTKTLPFPASRNSYNEQADALARLSSPQPMPISRSRVSIPEQTARFKEQASPLLAIDKVTADDVRNFAKQSPDAYAALEKMRNDILADAGYTIASFHGTNGSNFTVFDTEFGGMKTFADSARLGIFSTTSFEVATGYSENIGWDMFPIGDTPNQYSTAQREALQSEEGVRLIKAVADAEAAYSAARDRLYADEKAKAREVLEDKKGVLNVDDAMLEQMIETVASLHFTDAMEGKVPPLLAEQKRVADAQEAVKDYVRPYMLAQIPNKRVLNLRLKMTNPLIYDMKGQRPDQDPLTPKLEQAIKEGRDGVIFKNIVDPDIPATHYVVFNSNQIKLADPLLINDEGQLILPDEWAQEVSPDIRYSRVVFGSSSPNPDRSVAATAADLMLTADGEWNDKLLGSRLLAKLFRPGGNIDPRVFQAYQYHRRGMVVVNERVRKLMPLIQNQLKGAPQNIIDDVALAAGTTEPTVPAADRAAAEQAYDAAIKAANAAYQASPGYAMYKDGLQKIRADFAIHQDKQLYHKQVKDLEVKSKDPATNADLAARDAAYAAAAAAKNTAIQQARAKNLKPLLKAQRDAQIRIEQHSPDLALGIADLRAAVDEASRQLRDELGVDDPMRVVIESNLNMYLTRAYRIHHDEGYAQQLLNFEDPTFAVERDNARNYFEAQWLKDTFKAWRTRAEYEVFTDDELKQLVQAEAKATDVGNDLLIKYVREHSNQPNVPVPGAERTDLSKFLLKQEVPAELKALLGEYTNPIENLVRTYATVANFAGTQRMLNQFTDIGLKSGQLVTAEEVAADRVKFRNYKQIVTTSRTRGGDPLSEYYAAPEVVETFDVLFNREGKKERSKLVEGIGWAAKTAVGASMAFTTLGSAGFYVRNICSIPIFGAMNGFVPTASNIRVAFEAIHNIYGKAGLSGLSADLIALGVAKNTFETGVIRDVMRGGAEDPNALGAQFEKIMGEFTKTGNLFDAVKNRGSKVIGVFGNLNDQIDSIYKIAYWAHEVDVLNRANKHRSVPLTLDQMKAEAARKVVRTSQGYDRIPPIAGDFMKSTAGVLFNSFFRFTAEMFRIPVETYSVAREEMKSGNPVLVRRGVARMAGLFGTAALAVAIPEIVKAFYGIGDDEEETARAALPEYQENSNLLLFRNPETGRLRVWDLTYLVPFSMITDKLARVMNLATSGDADKIPGVLGSMMLDTFLTPQIAVDAFTRGFLYNVDEKGQPIRLESDSAMDKSLKTLDYIRKEAYRLRTPEKLYHAFRAYLDGGAVDTGESVTNPLETLRNEVMPVRPLDLPLDRIGERALGYVRREQRAGLDQLKSELKSREAKSVEDIEDAYAAYEKTLVTTTAQFERYMRGLEKLGLSRAGVDRLAKNADISRKKIGLARQGMTERLVFSEEVREDIRRAGGTTRLNQLDAVINARPRYIPVNPK